MAGLIRRVGHNSIDGVTDHLVTESIYASASGNIGFEFYADKPRKKRVVSGDGSIPMSTLPLNVES